MHRFMIGNAVAGSSLNYALTLGFTDNKIEFWQNASGSALVSTASISDNNWRHLVATRSGSTSNWTITLYINGVRDSSVTSAANVNDPVSPETAIGRNGAQNANFTKGTIDDIRIYNRALSAQEVKTVFESR